MFTSEQYRTKATEYGDLLKTANGPNELREFQKLEQSFTTLADNEQWLADNYAKTLHAPGHGRAGGALWWRRKKTISCDASGRRSSCNGTRCRQSSAKSSSTMPAPWATFLETVGLRGQIACFLHKHKDDQDCD